MDPSGQVLARENSFDSKEKKKIILKAPLKILQKPTLFRGDLAVFIGFKYSIINKTYPDKHKIVV